MGCLNETILILFKTYISELRLYETILSLFYKKISYLLYIARKEPTFMVYSNKELKTEHLYTKFSTNSFIY